MRHALASLAVLMLLLVAGSAGAQSVTNAFQGFSAKSDQPVKVEAERLEVREKDQAAFFTGSVQVTQGDSQLRAATLVVHYAQSEAKGAAETGGRQISRLEAAGNVAVTAKNQKATGDRGVFDMQSNTVTLTGNVVVAQGTNVIRGDKLFVDLTKQTSRLETSGPRRVEGIFTPGAAKGNRPPTAPKAP